MNWVEAELNAVREVVVPDPDAWLRCFPSAPAPNVKLTLGECEHRWKTVPTYIPTHMRGFFTLPVKTVCRCCGAEA